MTVNATKLRIIKLHKKWADGLTVFWQVGVLALFGGTYFLLDEFKLPAIEKISMLTLLAVMVLIAAIWQAVGLGVARVHMIFDGVDLELKERSHTVR